MGCSAAGIMSIGFIGFAIKSAFNQWQEESAPDDKWPFGDDPADITFRNNMAALGSAFGVGWIAAILSGIVGTMIAGPVGGLLLGLIGGFMGGMAADQITRWLLGEGVEESGTRGVTEGWKALVEEKGLAGALKQMSGISMLGELPDLISTKMKAFTKKHARVDTEGEAYQADVRRMQTIEGKLKPINLKITKQKEKIQKKQAAIEASEKNLGRMIKGTEEYKT